MSSTNRTKPALSSACAPSVCIASLGSTGVSVLPVSFHWTMWIATAR